jgi:N-glycosylase/DNA lyase
LIAREFPVQDYALGETLSSGQAFRWKLRDGKWEGILHGHWVRLTEKPNAIRAELQERPENWQWLTEYLQTDADLKSIIQSFPQDEHMLSAVESSHGLHLLRQDPWECLASFILSSTKQIVQIQQIVALVCERFGEPVPVPTSHQPEYSFPSARKIASLSEADLRFCKMGFRAPYLKGSAEMIVACELNLHELYNKTLDDARAELMRLPGVGRKIADCVLLFAFGFQQAFPIDVWIMKALRQLYFPKRKKSLRKMIEFTTTYFGPNAGYAQQYLFHYMRTRVGRISK